MYLNKSKIPTPLLRNVCTKLLYILVFTLVFEGLLRKLVPSALSIIIFFLKDILCIVGLYITYDKYCFPWVSNVKQAWILVCIALIPLFIFTFYLDPILSVFAAKQYLLYAVVVLVVQYCFYYGNLNRLKNFLFYFSLLLLPTAAVAILQNSLPATSWLNQSVTGSSLEAFAAAGYLRVSSTFSFTGQYSWYLNVSCPFIITFITLSYLSQEKASFFKKVFWIFLSLTYIISIFITGGRTAVIGASAIITIAFACLLFRKPKWLIRNGIFLLILGFAALSILKGYKPEYFAAYEERSRGTETESHEEELQTRILGGFTDWIHLLENEDFSNAIMGNGLGVMSNGSDQVSTYAKKIRQNGYWTEGDASTIFWEGGIYLAVIWYAFRIFIIVVAFKIFFSLQNDVLAVAGAFLFSYILINGIVGTLSIQPPIAIWWWLAVGVLISLKYNEATISKGKQDK